MPDPKYKNAEKVTVVPEGYNYEKTLGNKKFYGKTASEAIPSTSGQGGGGDAWKQSIIKMLQSGVSPQELVNKGHISAKSIPDFEPYYKPIYTETNPPAPSQTGTISPAQGTRMAAYLQPKTSAGQQWDTYRIPDVSGKANVFKDVMVDPKTGNVIDANKLLQTGDYTKALTNQTLDQYRQQAVRSDAQGTTMLPTSTTQGTVVPDYSNVKTNEPMKSGTKGGGNLAGGFKNGGIVKYKAGGLVKHIKGYADGGVLTPEEQQAKQQKQVGNAGLTAGLVDTATSALDPVLKDQYGRYNTGSDIGNYAEGTGVGLLSGAAKGATMGASLGPEGMAAGAIAGGVIGGAKGAYEAWQGNKSISQDAEAKLKAQQEAYKRLENIKLQNNLAQQKLNQVNTYKDGGKIEGKGTAKSDSIKAKVKEDSFIVPAERNKIAEVVRKVVLKAPDSKKKANLNQKGGEEVRLSNGEHLFTPKEVEKIENTLGDTFLDKLAPNSAKKEDIKEGEFDEMEKAHMANGGLLSAHKAKIMLHEGTANGQPISDKQRRFFGWVAGGRKAEGGVIDAYAEGGDVLSTKQRNALPESSFVFEKERKYPIHDLAHARNALARVAQFGSPSEIAAVKAAVKSKYPEIHQGKENGGMVKGYADGGGVKRNIPSEQELKGIVEKNKQADILKKQKLQQIIADTERQIADPDFKEQGYKTKAYLKQSIEGFKNQIGNINRKYNLTDEPVKKSANIYSGTGAQIESAMSPQDKAKSLSSTATPKGSSLKAPSNVSKIGFKPNLATDNPDIVPPVSEKSKEQIDAEKQAANPAQKMAQTAQVSEPSGNKSGKYAGLINQGLSQLTGLGNYILPAKQTQMGLKYLAASGQRPVDIVDPGFQATVDRANANAKFGFTPEEQAALNMQNVDLLNAQKAAARNYSGGSAGNAYNMERDAANQSFARGLENTIGSRNLQMQKQGYADQMNLAKADKMRQLFEDRMGAWQQQQAAGAGLVGAGIRNLIGANRYSAELNSMNQANNFGNSWINNV